MDNNQNTPEIDNQDAGAPSNPTPAKGFKESLYDKVPLTRKQLDVIIIVLIVAFVVFLTLGTLIGNGIIGGPKF